MMKIQPRFEATTGNAEAYYLYHEPGLRNDLAKNGPEPDRWFWFVPPHRPVHQCSKGKARVHGRGVLGLSIGRAHSTTRPFPISQGR